MKTQNDKPTLELVENMDWIKKHFDHLIEVEAPRVFAIHGTWGSGKTSAMAQFFYALGGENKGWELINYNVSDYKAYKEELTNYSDLDHIKPVWFEAWVFQHEPNILQALLWEIRNQLASKIKIYESLKGKLAKTTMAAFEAAYKMAIQGIDKTLETVSSWYGLREVYQAGKEAFKGQPAPNNKFSEEPDSIVLREMLERAIDGLLGLTQILKKDLNPNQKNRQKSHTDKKVVIFIDDLDRCEPDKAFNILESIKIFLNLKNCVFVLGMDVDIISAKMDNDKDKAKGKLYLEKICQEIWHLPALNLKKRTAYAQKILQASLQDVNPKTKKLIYDEAFCKDLITTMGRALPVYYRSLKIWNNALVMFLHHKETKDLVEKNKHDDTHVKMLCILSYLYAFQHEIYKLIQIYGEEYYQKVLMEIDNVTGDNELEVHPSLKHLDIPFTHSGAEDEELSVSNRAFLPENPHKMLKVIDLIKSTPRVEQDLLDLLMI
jgi:hypothetical protein